MADFDKRDLGQQMIIGIDGQSLTRSEKDFIVENNIGGVILFSRNVDNPKQIYNLTNEIQSLSGQMRDKAPLFVAIDMEGGRVARLKAPFTQWPPMANIGKMDSPALGFKFAQAMGQELLSVGINLNFSPSVDILTNPKNELIGDRSFGTDPEIVGKMGSSVIRGFLKSGVIACAKHFPGHGNTIIDSHEDLPIEEIDFETLQERELIPFKRAFRARVDLVMTAHILYKNIDPDWPATMSEKIVKELIGKTGYKRLVISDDLDMKALTKNYDKEIIPVQSLKAGCNILLYCNEPESHIKCFDYVEKAVLDGKLDPEIIKNNLKMVLDLKKERSKSWGEISYEESIRYIGHPNHLQLSKSIANLELPPDINT